MDKVYNDILDYMQPNNYIVSCTEYDESYTTPVLTAGKSFILGKTNDQNGIFYRLPVIIFDDFTTDARYIDFPFKVKSSAIKMLIPKNKDVNLKFVYYSMKNQRYKPQSHNRQWISIYSKLELNFPDIGVQNKVVAKLDNLQKIIKLKNKQLEELDQLAKSLFYEMFGDIINNKKYGYIKVQDFTDVCSGGTPLRNVDEYWNGNIPWVKTTELKNAKILYSEEKISGLGLKNSSAKLVPIDTILIAMYGQGKTRGMTAKLEIPSTTNQACACILPSKLMNPIYLWHYFIHSYDNLRSLANGGNQPNLSGNIIKNYPVINASISLQNEFAKRIEAIEEQKEIIQSSISETQTLFNSLVQKYFD